MFRISLIVVSLFSQPLVADVYFTEGELLDSGTYESVFEPVVVPIEPTGPTLDGTSIRFSNEPPQIGAMTFSGFLSSQPSLQLQFTSDFTSPTQLELYGKMVGSGVLPADGELFLFDSDGLVQPENLIASNFYNIGTDVPVSFDITSLINDNVGENIFAFALVDPIANSGIVTGTPTITAVPEPSAFLFLGLVGLLAGYRSWRR